MGHGEHTGGVLLLFANEPTAQMEHVACPVDVVVYPVGQGSHCDLPVAACTYPTGHTVQLDSGPGP